MTIGIASFNLQNDRVYSESDKKTLLDLDRQYPFSTLDPPASALVALRGRAQHRAGHRGGQA